MEKRMLIMIRTVLFFGLVLVLIGLGAADTALAQGKLKVLSLVFASGSVGGSWHPIAAAMVEKAHEFMEGRPISVRPVPVWGFDNALMSPRPCSTANCWDTRSLE